MRGLEVRDHQPTGKTGWGGLDDSQQHPVVSCSQVDNTPDAAGKRAVHLTPIVRRIATVRRSHRPTFSSSGKTRVLRCVGCDKYRNKVTKTKAKRRTKRMLKPKRQSKAMADNTERSPKYHASNLNAVAKPTMIYNMLENFHKQGMRSRFGATPGWTPSLRKSGETGHGYECDGNDDWVPVFRPYRSKQGCAVLS